MNHEDLLRLVGRGEGATVEFKRSGMAQLGREMCAFANAVGGSVFLGVSDDGTIVGVENHNRLKSEVQATARSAEPSILVQVESVGVALVARVPRQEGKPFSFGGKFFIRDGASSQQMSREEVREFFFKEGLIYYDETPCSRFDLKCDLSASGWALFCSRAQLGSGLNAPTTLRNLNLIRDGQMTHAGAWLLVEEIQKISASATVTCAMFRGTQKEHILDRKEFTGNLPSIYEGCMVYLQANLNTALVPNAVGRREQLELPVEALREAVVNGIVHRDYRAAANTHIYIFRDRVEIVTPGGLPPGMREEDLGVKSVPRNPLLFGVFQRMGLVEQIGSGICRIHRRCEEYGVAEPQIQVTESWVTTTFFRPDLGRPESRPESRLEARVVELLHDGPLAKSAISKALGQKKDSGQLNRTIRKLIRQEVLEFTIPEKPSSRLQRYRLTARGRGWLSPPCEG